MFKGTVIENSLADKSILNDIIIEKTWHSGDWVLHNVLAEEELIERLSSSLSSGPWYIHLWKPGEDLVKVIFQNRIFEIQYSDKSTWTEAVTYGKSIGIPEEQLDFVIS